MNKTFLIMLLASGALLAGCNKKSKPTQAKVETATASTTPESNNSDKDENTTEEDSLASAIADVESGDAEDMD